MGNTLSAGQGTTLLFPAELLGETMNLARGKSSLAKLSGAGPMAFNGQTLFTFNLDKEVDFVAENGAKSNGGGTVGTISMHPIKMEYGVRVSDEFRYGSAEVRLPYLRLFSEGFATRIARGLDIGAFHGVNPRTGAAAASTVGSMYFDGLVTGTASMTVGTDPDAAGAVEAAIALVQGAEQEATGIAMSPSFRSALASQTYTDGRPMFPDLRFGGQPEALGGLAADVNNTVSFTAGSMTNSTCAYVGNFRDCFRWGYAREVEITVIPYGNPDNDASAGDLAGHNQVYLRAEAYLGWAVLLPSAFARVVS